MKPRLALVAQEIIIASDTGVPSAIHIMEGIQAQGFPMFLQNIAFLTVWTKEDGDASVNEAIFRFYKDDKEELNNRVSVNFNGDVGRQVIRIQGLIVEKPCKLKFELRIGEKNCEYTICVKAQPKVEQKADGQNVEAKAIG